MKRISTATLLVALGLGLSAGRAMAQQEGLPQTPADDLRTRLEQQQQEIDALQAQIRGTQQTPQFIPTANQPAQDQAGQVQAADPPCCYEVGSDLSIKTDMKDGLFLWFETPNKDFTMHIGGWIQFDNVWWNESTALKTKATARTSGVAPFGVASGGIANGSFGDLQDGEYFRRIRPFVEGTFWETGEYRLIVALENDQYSICGFDEFWVGETKIPVIGSMRAGHVKDAVGLEGDMTSSSRCMTFMERSSYSEAIELNQNFLTGLWLGNDYLDQRVTSQFVAGRADQGSSSGEFFGDGQAAVQGRLTCLPIYEDEGRELLHFGVSAGWRDGTNNLANTGTGTQVNTIELRARPEMRDDDPAGSPSSGQAIPDANSIRMIDTSPIAANNEYLMGLETLYIRGPFSFQAEYGWNWINNATGLVQATTNTITPIPTQSFVFNGGYAQVAYTLTGENRAYDKHLGTLARQYFGHAGPYENAYLVDDDEGHLCWGLGAWEIAARYSYTDLNDVGTGGTFIQGGQMEGFSLALNWYVNTNLNVMFDWAHDRRYDLPVGTNYGSTDGYGVRVQFQF
jgi:phosphate-selective porin OprO/OprP